MRQPFRRNSSGGNGPRRNGPARGADSERRGFGRRPPPARRPQSDRPRPPRDENSVEPAPSVATTLPVSPATATKIAATVIRWANHESPADQVLRTELKKTPGMTRELGSLTAERVFAYYRWLGWLKESAPTDARIEQAFELDLQFRSEPSSFLNDELLAKAVPAWAANVMDVTPEWVRTLQRSPTLWVRAKPGMGERLGERLFATRPGPLPDSFAYTGTEDLFSRPEFHAGEFEIQDLSSQVVGHLCQPQPKQTWWDACAGEGGKTLLLSALMQNKGLIWASDRAEWRLTRLKRRAARAGVFNYRVATWDGGERLPTKTLFDGVLVDGPCSGLGTWQRNPHARWTAQPEDVAELAVVQENLLHHAAAGLKPGARLVYSVCTLARAETSDIVEKFGQRHPEFRLEPFSAPAEFLAGARSKNASLPVTPQPGVIWVRPEDWQANGMFIAQWRRH